jgi:hypothetical protein
MNRNSRRRDWGWETSQFERDVIPISNHQQEAASGWDIWREKKNAKPSYI